MIYYIYNGSELLGFVYCVNNPSCRKDLNGNFSLLAATVLIGVALLISSGCEKKE